MSYYGRYGDRKPKQRVIPMTGVVTEKTAFTFGKYRDWKVGDVPASYLLWCYEQKDMREKHPGLWHHIDDNLEWLRKEDAADQERRKRRD